MFLDDNKNITSDSESNPYEANVQLSADEDYSADRFESDDSYPSLNQDKFDDEEYQFDKGYRGELKEHAKRSALQNLKRKFIDKPLDSVGGQVLGKKNFDSENSKDRDAIKEEAKKRAKKFAGEKLKNLGGEAFQESFQKGLNKSAGTLAKEGAKKLAGKAAAKAGVKAGAQAATKGLEGAITAAGVAAGPETLGLGTIAAFLLNIAISLGVSEAVDCLFSLKDGNLKEARLHALKAVALISMFIILLITVLLCLSVGGIILGAPLLILINIYGFIGLGFKESALLQGLGRKWMWGIVIGLDFFVIMMVLVVGVGILYGVCHESSIGSLLGWTGTAGQVVNYVDKTVGTGGYIAALNEICAAIPK